jgi:hypothetical protein
MYASGISQSIHLLNVQLVETALVMSHAMGRTLVLPPQQRFYLLGKQDASQKTDFDFGDFFHLDSIAVEHEGFNVISSEEFLHRLGTTGKLINAKTGRPEIWNEKAQHTSSNVKSYLQKVGVNPQWNPTNCIAVFPSGKGATAIEALQQAFRDIMSEKDGRQRPTLEEFEGKPVPVNAPIEERMRELLTDRSELCIYDEQLQQAPVLFFSAARETRLLTHFYAFIFFADWRADLWSKRFVRDHLRYIDEIMCAAARVVQAVRQRSKHEDGLFDSMHVRRGGEHMKSVALHECAYCPSIQTLLLPSFFQQIFNTRRRGWKLQSYSRRAKISWKRAVCSTLPPTNATNHSLIHSRSTTTLYSSTTLSICSLTSTPITTVC